MSVIKRLGEFTPLLVLMILFSSGFSDVRSEREKLEILTSLSIEELLKVKVYSASKIEEPLNESPVPVTIITRDMIRNSGAKNLKDLLLTYVPGAHYIQDGGETVVALRGIYTSSQQKILVLLDGVRLNQRVFSAMDADYSISLEKIKQIEILRGPASSLYGNVALTGVINIITGKGGELDGMLVKAGMGNHDQVQLNFTGGKDFNECDFLVWGQLYQASGEKTALSAEENWSAASAPGPGHYYIDRYKNKPSHDIGIRITYKNFTIIANDGASKLSQPFSTWGEIEGQTFDREAYKKFRGIEAGGTEFFHKHLAFNFRKSYTETGMDLDISVYHDKSGFLGLGVSDPHLEGEDTLKTGIFGIDDYDLGFLGHATRHYKMKRGKGKLTIGIQNEFVHAYEGFLIMRKGVNHDEYYRSDSRDKPMMPAGDEYVHSVFGQMKHHFTKNLVANMGLRFDYKIRKKTDMNYDRTIAELSPRMALIYKQSGVFNIKFSFARSFVDPPYWYRNNNLSAYQGASGLKPEYLQSFQLTPTLTFMRGKLVLTSNIYYNHLFDFLIYNPEKEDPLTGQKYYNAGELKTVGIEEEIAYVNTFYRFRFNFFTHWVMCHKDYQVINNRIKDVPRLTGNLILDLNPFRNSSRKVWLNLTGRYIGEQYSPIAAGFTNFPADPENKIDAAFIVNSGLNYENFLVKKLILDLRVFNLFDYEYYQGGTVKHPYRQAGRWFLVSLGYKFQLG